MSKTNPSGWVSTTLSKHIDLLTGFAFKSSEYKEQGIRLLRGDNVMQNNIRWDDAKFWDENSYEELSRYQLQEHDIVIALDRTWVKAGLKVSVIRKRDIPSLLVQRVARLRAKSTLNQSFLSYIVRSHRFEQMAKFSKTETAVPHISPSDIRNFKIEIPSLLEQSNIAKILELWDNAIEKMEALIAAKEKQFEGLTQRLFKPNHSWKPYRLGELFDNRKESNNTDLPMISITRDKGVIPHSETNRKDNSSEDKSKYLRIRPNDIGYNTMRMWQGVSALSGIDGIVSPAYTICIPKKIVDPEFMAFLFKTKPMIHKFYRYSQGLTSDTWNLKFHHFCEVKAEIPDIETQVEIAQILNTAKQEIDLIKKTLEQYRSQKRGLMQKLLTGDWQVGSSQHLSEETCQELSRENVA